MTTEQIVFRSCLALWAVAMLVVTDQMGAGQPSRSGDTNEGLGLQHSAAAISAPTNSDNWDAMEATSALIALKRGGCIEWDRIDQRVMTCGDTVPAVKIVSVERRYVQ